MRARAVPESKLGCRKTEWRIRKPISGPGSRVARQYLGCQPELSVGREYGLDDSAVGVRLCGVVSAAHVHFDVSGSAVVVSSTGRLGVTVSSEHYKTAIASMGSNSEKLTQLRPVTFHLKTDPKGALQYGLIAEEVAKVYPELVIRNESGRIDGVRYDELAPMLLNEVQQQAAEIRDLKEQMAELKDLKQELHAALAKLQAENALLAQR